MPEPSEPTLEDAIPGFSAVAGEIERCGWAPAPHPELNETVFFRTFQGGHPAPCLRLGNGQGEFLLLIGLESIRLPGDDELFPRFLDLSLEERMALTLARSVGGADRILLLTRERLDLLRLADEANECRVATREEFEGALLPALSALARGRTRSGTAGSRPLPGAESLGGWVRHWSLQLASALETGADRAEKAIWKWIVMLQLARRLEGTEAGAGNWGLRCAEEEGGWTVSFDAVSATDDLCRSLESFDETFITRQLEAEDDSFYERLRRLDDTSMIDRLRAELLMHSQNRFEPETIVWLFTDLEREQQGWRREVRGVEPVRRRMQMNGWTVYAPLIVDVAAYGLTAALNDTDRLAECLNEQNLFERRRMAAAGESMLQPDLFCPNPRGINPKGQLDDGLNYLFGETLRLAGVGDEQRVGVAVALLLKALTLAPRMGWPFIGVDTLDRVFLPAEG